MLISDENPLGHGMGAEPESKDWPHINEIELSRLKKNYIELDGDLKIIWRSPRPFSSALIVEVHSNNGDDDNSERNLYFIKRSYHSFRKVKDLLEEHEFIRYLQKVGINVPRLVHSLQNTTALQIGNWTYEVHHRADGLDIYADQLSWKPFYYPEHAAKAGELLAKLHNRAEHFLNNEGRSARYLVSNQKLLESDDIVLAIKKRIRSSRDLKSYFADKDIDQKFFDQISHVHQNVKVALQTAPKIWTHNDFHASNLLWSENTSKANVSTLIDFGLSDRNSAIYDLAVAIERNFIDWLNLENSQEIYIDQIGLATFIQAYLSNIESASNLKFLPDLLKIVHLDFAFSELEYFIGITKNLKHADAAYYDWILSHTYWFTSEYGQKFTEYLTYLINLKPSQN